MVWVQIPSREDQNLTALKSNSDTGLIFRRIYIYIWYRCANILDIYIYKNYVVHTEVGSLDKQLTK
jgi:hypothetical protein